MTTFKKRGNSIRKIDGIKQAMSLMGFSFNENSNVLQSGYVNYRKKNIRVQNRRLKLTEIKPKTHLFFDDDGNICDLKSNECTNSIQSMDEVPETFESDLLTLGSTCVDTEMLGYEAHSSSMEDCDEIVDENKKQRKKRRKLRKCPNLPQEIVENKNLLKYWLRRYQLFSKFDKGIKLDAGKTGLSL